MRNIATNIFIIVLFILFVSCNNVKDTAQTDKSCSVFYAKSPQISIVRNNIVKESLTWLGVEYKYGGAEKTTGTDCSGMVLRVYESAANIKLPRNSYKQGEFCRKISVNDVRPGDLVFFTTGKDSLKISHVGIMLDDNQFVHASSKKGVVINRITEPYYSRHLIMFGIVPGIK